jgi:hypothetical protein
MPVIDDTQSIIRCSNKVFLEELLRREGIPTPRTLVVTARTPWEQVCELGDPFVIKLPDSSFSAAVHKISSQAEYRSGPPRCSAVAADHRAGVPADRVRLAGHGARRAPCSSPRATTWRAALADPLGAGRRPSGTAGWRRSPARAPRAVVELALRAAALIGDGLYGVDIKETPSGPVVIEINDNPNLDAGDDDAADGDRDLRGHRRLFRAQHRGDRRDGTGRGSGAAARGRAPPSGGSAAPLPPLRGGGDGAGVRGGRPRPGPGLAGGGGVPRHRRPPTSDVEIDGVGYLQRDRRPRLRAQDAEPTASLRPTAEELLVAECSASRERCEPVRRPPAPDRDASLDGPARGAALARSNRDLRDLRAHLRRADARVDERPRGAPEPSARPRGGGGRAAQRRGAAGPLPSGARGQLAGVRRAAAARTPTGGWRGSWSTRRASRSRRGDRAGVRGELCGLPEADPRPMYAALDRFPDAAGSGTSSSTRAAR